MQNTRKTKAKSTVNIMLPLLILVLNLSFLVSDIGFAANSKTPEVVETNSVRLKTPELIETTASSKITPKKFRLHLTMEPVSLEPSKLRSGASTYLLSNLHRNLFKYDENDQLVPDLVERCTQKKLTLKCTLKKNLKWSDGSDLTAQDFVSTYLRILDPQNKTLRADLLFPVKNAREVYQGKLKPETLGIKALNKQTLQFELASDQGDFRHKLANTILAPTKKDLSAFSGPYALDKWLKGKKIELKKNIHFHNPNPQGPDVEFLFIEEDGIALNLYEKGELDFLRRLPTLYIEKYQTRPDFHWLPLLRMDYLGFAGKITDQSEIRKALTESLNYTELQKIFSAPVRPGCLGLPSNWFSQAPPCYDFNPQLKKITKSSRLNFIFSAAGGDDHKRTTEWLQNQWKKHANLNVQLEAKDQKIFLELLTKNPPDIFRKGQPLDEPTCLNALQIFESTSLDNVLRITDSQIDKWVQELRKNPPTKDQQKICSEAFTHVLQTYRLIPLGELQFATLRKSYVKGIKINRMNQLDLSQIRVEP